MFLTLFCDGSYHAQTGAGGWGAWAMRPDWLHARRFGGPLPRRRNVVIFETQAVAEALDHLAADGSLLGIHTLKLRSDSLAALQIMADFARGRFEVDHKHTTGSRRRIPWLECEAALGAAAVIERFGLQLQMRHVAGHRAYKGGEHAVLGMCDSTARMHMEAERRRIHDHYERVRRDKHVDKSSVIGD